MNRIRFIYKHLIHIITARNTNGFGVHSPFVYQFIKSVIYEKNAFYAYDSIEKLRKELQTDKRVIDFKDFGTGFDRRISVQSIAQKSVKSAKYGQLLFRLIHYSNLKQVIELGTSLGITTSYLAKSSSDIQCITFDGCPEICKIAMETFNKLELKNIQVIPGNIDETLVEVLKKKNEIDFVFFDANHQLDATINYFELCLTKIHAKTIFVFDDIYWSVEMIKAWKKIKTYPQVTTTIDLFQMGIVFFNSDLHKRNYKMRF